MSMNIESALVCGWDISDIIRDNLDNEDFQTAFDKLFDNGGIIFDYYTGDFYYSGYIIATCDLEHGSFIDFENESIEKWNNNAKEIVKPLEKWWKPCSEPKICLFSYYS